MKPVIPWHDWPGGAAPKPATEAQAKVLGIAPGTLIFRDLNLVYVLDKATLHRVSVTTWPE